MQADDQSRKAEHMRDSDRGQSTVEVSGTYKLCRRKRVGYNRWLQCKAKYQWNMVTSHLT